MAEQWPEGCWVLSLCPLANLQPPGSGSSAEGDDDGDGSGDGGGSRAGAGALSRPHASLWALVLGSSVCSEGCQPCGAWIQPQLTLTLSQVIVRANVSNVNPNRRHTRKVYYGHRLIETEKPVLYLLLCGVKSQGHLALAAQPQALGYGREWGLALGQPREQKGRSASACLAATAPRLPPAISSLQFTSCTFLGRLSSSLQNKEKPLGDSFRSL